eukprot:12886370-Prorocentrum_lima.AAC.1
MRARELASGALHAIYIRCAKQLEAARRSWWADAVELYLPNACKDVTAEFLGICRAPAPAPTRRNGLSQAAPRWACCLPF